MGLIDASSPPKPFAENLLMGGKTNNVTKYPLEAARLFDMPMES